MKKFATVIALILVGLNARSQHTADLGVQLSGAAYFWGDVQQVDYSKSVTPLLGAFGRWNFNKRLAIRGQLTAGNLKAVGSFPDAMMFSPGTTRNLSNYYVPQVSDSFNFKRAIQTVEALFEFNFFNYKLGSLKKENFTPFVSLGVGGLYSRAPRTGTFILAGDPANPVNKVPFEDNGHPTNRTDVVSLIIPVGMGIKFNITKNLGGMVEVIVRKTFADNIDNLDDPARFQNQGDQAVTYAPKFARNSLTNNDWYATCTASLVYRLSSIRGNCRIYDTHK